MLTEINAKDLFFTGNIEDDRTNTFVELNDYDWMQYKIRTRFCTETLGILYVEFEYFGFTFCTMKVRQNIKDNEYEYVYSYSSEIFKEHMKDFLKKHIESWDSTYAFNGEELIVDFYNDVLKRGILTDGINLNPSEYKNESEE